MKLKYYMRGIGVGIVFTVLLFFFLRPEKEMSDDDIVLAAKKLGMVEASKNDINLDAIKNPQTVTTGASVVSGNSGGSKQPQDMDDINPSTEASKTEGTTPAPSLTPTPTNGPTPTNEPTPTNKPTSTPVPTSTPIPEPTNTVTNDEYITVKITKGMTSWKFALYARDIGLIENTEEFDSYLVKNGYASKLNINTYRIKKGSSYYEIAEIITGR